ncbi:hypothetical protein ACP4OV_016509 [Aristida adscensionis]
MRTPRAPRRRDSPSSARPPGGFSPGDLVEVFPDDEGLRGAHFEAVVVKASPKPRGYTVEYDALLEAEGSDRRLRETVPARSVRPRPPPPPPAPAAEAAAPAEHAAVDALVDDAWWLGVAFAVGGAGGRVTVCFPETREVAEFDAAHVRPHLEWSAGEWVSPESMEIPKTMPYTKGMQVEVSKLEDKSVVAWLPAVVVKNIWKNNLLVEYTFPRGDGNALSEEIVDMKHVRPCPPHASAISFCINDEVEAFQGDGWWLGVITDVHPEFRYTFKSAHSEMEVQVDQKSLRLRYDWVDGQWEQESQNVRKRNFTKDMKVEVSNDDEGFCGAWFEGTVLKSVGNKFLVEYATLKAEDETSPLTEAVEVRHLRPSPPDIPVINGFKLFDEVDAFCNDGWWVGVVSKVISDKKYMVYFRTSKEEMEFEHKQLRFHCDWMGGRWMRASPVRIGYVKAEELCVPFCIGAWG